MIAICYNLPAHHPKPLRSTPDGASKLTLGGGFYASEWLLLTVANLNRVYQVRNLTAGANADSNHYKCGECDPRERRSAVHGVETQPVWGTAGHRITSTQPWPTT